VRILYADALVIARPHSRGSPSTSAAEAIRSLTSTARSPLQKKGPTKQGPSAALGWIA